MTTNTRTAKPLRTVLYASISAALMGAASAANAAAIITGIDFQLTPSGGTLNAFEVDNDNNTIDLTKAFTSIAPLKVSITVGHTQAGGNNFDVTESISNQTGIDFSDYHITIIEPDSTNGIVFNAFQSSTLNGFTLDNPPDSGPRNLNFTGALAAGGVTDASFTLSLVDPGQGNSYTFDLVQTPTVIPLPAAVWLLGSGLLGVAGITKRRRAS